MSPLWTLFKITLLTLLAARNCAHADSAPTEEVVHSYQRGYYYNAEYEHCNNRRRTRITAIGCNSRYFEEQKVRSTYGEDIAIFCSSGRHSNLTILEGKRQLPANRLNSTTVHVSLFKPNVGGYKYYCRDSDTNCTHALHLYVAPAISVTGPHVIHALNLRGDHVYLVPRHEVGNVFCSVNFVGNASIRFYDSDGFHKLQTTAVNETTVMAAVTNFTEGEQYRVFCEDTELYSELWMIRDYYPEVKGFKCILHQEQEVECWWESSSKRNNFKLFVLYDQGSTQVCLHRSGGTTGGCKSLLDEELSARLKFSFTFQLQTCYSFRGFFCSNQTFDMVAEIITKVVPIHDLKSLNTSSRSVAVAWRHKCARYCQCAYKVEYRLLGTDWRPANVSSSVRCEYDYFGEACELQIPLPCPDAHYELRIYARHGKAIEDIYWSEPSTLFFYTARSTVGEVDPACDPDFREVTDEPPPSANVILYEVKQLVSDERKEENALRKHVTDMYTKIAQIKALLNAQM